MADYPYTLKHSSLEDFLQKMSDRPEPKKVTQIYLKSLGYTSSNDWALANVLKFIGFIEGSKPTDLFRNFRDTQKQKGVMAQAIRDSYAGLLELSEKLSEIDDQSLENFFRTATGRGDRMLKATINAFKTLCKFADFGAPPVTPVPTPPTPTPTPGRVQLPITPERVRLDVSIRIELPVTQDADVYDKIFKSLKKHLLNPKSGED